ncbi:MalM family protein, partial [Photobacterium sanctipauli]
MKIIKTTLAALLAATLMGCATSPTTENVKDVTISQPACCALFSEFEWIPMQGDDIDFAIDQYSQIGDFAEGKSYFAGFVLPENVDRMRVDLNSWLRVAGVFAPKVLLLDENFQVVESIELNDFELKLSDMFRLSS